MNKKVALSLAVIVAAAIGLGAFLKGEKFVPQTETLTFERNLDIDEGHGLNPAELVSTEGVRLTDVYSPSTQKFTPERKNRYGAERTEQGGVGLEVHFVHKDGGKVTSETFTLAGWQRFEETTRPARRKLVEDAEPSFAEYINNFVAPVGITRSFGIALDTTEGVSAALGQRVREVIAETGVQFSGADPKNTVVLNLYNITELAYQGGRQRPALTTDGALEKSVQWLLEERRGRSNSSVFGGLKAVLEEMADNPDSRPVLHIFTDGLENTDTLSVYKQPTLLDNEDGWATMDKVADFAKLDLAKLTVHLHPLPTKSAGQATMMEKGLRYLADRLKKAGAKVTVEPL